MRATSTVSTATRSWRVFFLLAIGIKVGHSEWNLPQCSGTGLKYLQGNALAGSTSCIGPDNKPYPTNVIDKMFSVSASSYRKGRSSKLMDPLEVQKNLIRHYAAANHATLSSFSGDFSLREDRSLMSEIPSYFSDNQSRRRPASEANKGSVPGGCSSPGRLCKTRYNTTAPMYGVSLTSGQAVTIVQKFPDLLQQVIFEVCDTKECDLLHGECVQTYVPYLFLVIPLGPVTLTGQDYVLVENGCVCRPKYPKVEQDTSPTDVLPNFSHP